MIIKIQVNKQIKKTDFSISDKNCDVNETKPPPLPLSFSCRKGYLKEVKNNQGIVMSTKKVLGPIKYVEVQDPKLGRFYLLPKIYKQLNNVPAGPVIHNCGYYMENISAC